MKLPTIPLGLDSKKLPTLGTNQIAGFAGFRPLASLEKIIIIIIDHLRDEVFYYWDQNYFVIFFSIFKFGSPSEEFQLYTLRGDDNVLISHIVYRFD